MQNREEEEDSNTSFMNTDFGVVTANGTQLQARIPCSLEAFLIEQKLLPRSVVVELNGEAVAPSEFAKRTILSGDRLEIVKIVAGG
jgi:thiamine biosynthesis protein ThiS